MSTIKGEDTKYWIIHPLPFNAVLCDW